MNAYINKTTGNTNEKGGKEGCYNFIFYLSHYIYIYFYSLWSERLYSERELKATSELGTFLLAFLLPTPRREGYLIRSFKNRA